MKLTPWFDPWVRPKRKGVYQTSWFGDGYSYFNGAEWTNQRETVASALYFKHNTEGAAQEKAWRGLAEKPE
jgi:hypothetical protein